MVQAAATTAISALGAVADKFSNQSRAPRGEKPQVQSILPLIPITDKKKIRELKKAAKEERLYNLLMQPEVIGLLMTFAGMYAAQHIPFTDNDAANATLQGTATTAAVLIGLGHAGVGDMTTSTLAGMAGISSLFAGLVSAIPDIGGDIGSDWYKYLFPFGGLWATLT